MNSLMHNTLFFLGTNWQGILVSAAMLGALVEEVSVTVLVTVTMDLAERKLSRELFWLTVPGGTVYSREHMGQELDVAT